MKRVLVTLIFAIATCSVNISQTLAQEKPKPQEGGAEAQVLKVDEEFRVAKLKNDTQALERIMADNFYETNQNGNSRDKAQIIKLFTDFKIESLTTDESRVRVTGDTAVVTGSQTEGRAASEDRMLFMRVYVRRQSGWQLLASMQFRNPKLVAKPGGR